MEMLSREDALKLLRENVRNEKMILHMIAVGAIMRELARYFGENEDLCVWRELDDGNSTRPQIILGDGCGALKSLPLSLGRVIA